MSFNLTLSTNACVICVTDRRLTLPGGVIVTERSTKLTTFNCLDAHGFITYNGIGRDRDGNTPSDWLCDQPDLMNYPLFEVAERIKNDAERRIRRLGLSSAQQRHSFVLSGYHMLTPFVMLISNYEDLSKNGFRAKADPSMKVEAMRCNGSSGRGGVCLLATGALPPRPVRMRNAIMQRVRRGDSAISVRSAMVKAVRDVAYGSGRRGTVGTSVMSGMVGPVTGFDVNSHVPGGTTVQESPNYMSPGMVTRDVVIDVSGGAFKSRYDPKTVGSRVDEPPCPRCGTPVPEGYRRCGVCDQAM